MSFLTRFGISLENDLLAKFDREIAGKGYTNRSEAIRDLIRADLVKKEWEEGKEVAGAIAIVYDHHKRQLLNKLMHIQHDFQKNILSTQHIHLDHHNCFEIIVVRGQSKDVQGLYAKLKAQKGVKHADFAMATTGKEVD